MLYPVIFILLASVVLVAFLNIRANILLEYVRKDNSDTAVLSFFALGGLLKYKYEIPMMDFSFSGIRSRLLRKKGRREKTSDGEEKLLGLNEFIDRYKYMKRLRWTYSEVVEYLKHRMVLKELKLNIAAGTGDAFYTGLLGGVLWSVAGLITAFFENNFKVEKRKIYIRPEFTKKVFNVDLYCIFTLKTVHIIVVALKILYRYLKIRIKRKRKRR